MFSLIIKRTIAKIGIGVTFGSEMEGMKKERREEGMRDEG
jgi:hypothetical protein